VDEHWWTWIDKCWTLQRYKTHVSFAAMADVVLHLASAVSRVFKASSASSCVYVCVFERERVAKMVFFFLQNNP